MNIRPMPFWKWPRTRSIDLIVMGTRGRSRMKRLILGSVAQQVVGQAPCPVMIVPA